MAQPNGIHHLAIMSTDIKSHIAFFSEVVGCPLVALFDMHGVPDGIIAFLRLNDHSYFSVVQLPDAAKAPIVIGQTHPGSGAGASAPGTLQHVAFNVDDEATLIAMRDRIRAQGVNVLGPIDHGMCKSIYFGGPDRMALEVACSERPLNPLAWIDPATLAAVGINAEEAARYKLPMPYSGPSPLAQPPYDPAKPHQDMPVEQYQMLLRMTDEEVTAMASYAEPPVNAPH